MALELEKAENEEIIHRLERVGFFRHHEEECLRSTRSGTVRWAKAGMERRKIVHLGREGLYGIGAGVGGGKASSSSIQIAEIDGSVDTKWDEEHAVGES